MKKLSMKLVAPICIAVVLVGVFFATFYISASIGFSIKIDKEKIYNEVEGFGASSAWITQQIGSFASESSQDEIVEALYGDSGLRLSIYRYNIGGGSNELGDKISYANNERATESFFLSEKYVDNSSFADESNYDWTRDAGAVGIMNQAIEKGNIRKVVLFVNSPHYLLTESGMTHGSTEYQDNLPKKNQEAFANYLIIIAKNMYEKFFGGKGLDVYISPINEPQWRWGGAAIQEGCHYSPKNLNETMVAVYDKLLKFNEENGLNIKLEAYESGSYLEKHNNKYLKQAKSSQWFKDLDALALHSYHKSKSLSSRKAFYKLTNKKYDKNIAMTEFCDLASGRDYSMNSALYVSQVIIRDLTYLNATEWGWWLGVSAIDYDDGLVYWDYDNEKVESIITYSKRYFCMGQFSKYIDIGAKRIDLNTSWNIPKLSGLDVVGYLLPDGNIVLVAVNSSKNSKIIKLNGYECNTVIVTTDDKDMEATNVKTSKIALEPRSVTTLFIQG